MGNSLPDFDPDFAGPAEWATMYRAIGLQIIPGYMPGEGKGSWKRPLLSEWVPLQNELVPDATFAFWYGVAGKYAARENMGLITGRCSGNGFIIDLDSHKNPAALAWWNAVLEVENSGLDLETVEQRTGGGGVQKLFLAPEGFVVPTCKTSIGVDIRGQGGFAVLPPSLHESGQHYDWLPGRAPWEIAIEVAPAWLLEAIVDLAEAHGGGVVSTTSERPIPTSTSGASGEQVLNEFGIVIDGREHLMRDVVWHAVLELYRAAPIKPAESEWRAECERAYYAYEAKVLSRLQGAEKTQGLEKEGRGISEFLRKWKRMMRLWGAPKMVEAAAKPAPATKDRVQEDPAAEFQQATEQVQSAAKTNPDALFEVLDVLQIKNLPDPKWLVSDLIIEEALGFIYGPPGCLKTFIALDLALSFATGQAQWWGRDIQRHGAVIYISAEGTADLKFRLLAWEQNRKTVTDAAPFRLIRQSINFMNVSDIGKLLATVEAVAAATDGPIAAVFVDTVSRVLPGAEENQQRDMTLFVAACDAVRLKFKATVIGIHHTAWAGNIRGSTVIPGAGDFLIEVRREPGALTGSIFAKKIKAAEDGWEQHFIVSKLTVGEFGAKASLALDPSAPVPKETGLGWPDRDVCRQILAAIDEQWRDGKPWCHALNTSRAAVTNIIKRWKLERKIVVDILATWTANGIIAEEEYDHKNRITGYRKMIDI